MTTSTRTPTDPAVAPLFRPFSLGTLDLPNRVVMAPMTRRFSPDGVPGPDVAAYYARRAAGGVGLIVTEGTYVDHPSAGEYANVPRFHGEEALLGWKGVVEAVHAAGGRIMPQLWHVGPVRKPGAPPFPDAPVFTPSGLGPDGTPIGAAGPVPTARDIGAVITAFAEGAATAQRLGFDGVELHGAHGYLIDSFLWEGTNRRTDAYGGDPVARTRLAAEIIAAVREATSPDFPVVLRISQWKGSDYTARIAQSPAELESVLTPLVEAGVDAIHASTRRYWLPEFDGSPLNLAGWVKKLTGLPVISVGSVGLDEVFTASFTGGEAHPTGLDQLLERLGGDEFDLIAVGRALLTDPEWTEKIRTGRAGEVVTFTREDFGRLT
ncbi:NADH:flavin oxidoreductase [Streptomyces sp. ST2-7A]|uniref:NADH:flavin oxidoreductase n=1 Tax=Streptomyces sp. ST2-7A TaxID=2907214 RepID=UPI001F27FB3D|nr:NADH:flavin oxidoreductase [Streptomyces sp. ST2-7A]MCE7079831.1 NADH:flavin oxidoreductase [Streptomyces sp. ST2-7A]